MKFVSFQCFWSEASRVSTKDWSIACTFAGNMQISCKVLSIDDFLASVGFYIWRKGVLLESKWITVDQVGIWEVPIPDGEQSASFSSDFCDAQSDPVLTLALFVLQFVEERGFPAHWGRRSQWGSIIYLEYSLLIDCFFKLYILILEDSCSFLCTHLSRRPEKVSRISMDNGVGSDVFFLMPPI